MGTSLGVLLKKSDVELVTRNCAHVDAINACGASIVGDVNKTVRLKACLPSQMTGEYDVIIFAVKQRESACAAQFLLPFLKKDGCIVTVQNGLPEESLAEVFSADNVYGCTLSWGAEIVQPGVVSVTSKAGFRLGLGSYGKGSRLFELVSLFSFAGEVTVGDLNELRFAKLAVNASFSTLSAISGLDFYTISKKYKKYALALIREVFLVARACGCKKLPQNGHDLFAVFGNAFSKLLLPVAMKPYRETRSGMLRDIQAGRRCDVDYVAGAVIRKAEEAGLNLPLMQAAVSLVHDVENGLAEIAPDTILLLKEGI